MAANKHKKIRAAVCYSVKNAKLSRLHNNANIITLGSRLTKKNTAFKCIEVFMNTKFEGGSHKKRVLKILEDLMIELEKFNLLGEYKSSIYDQLIAESMSKLSRINCLDSKSSTSIDATE